MKQKQAPEACAFRSETGPQGPVLVFEGRLDVHSTPAVWKRVLAALEARGPAPVAVDASKLEYCDGAGVGLLLEIQRRRQSLGPVEIRGLRPEFANLLAEFQVADFPYAPLHRRETLSLTREIGRDTLAVWHDLREMVSFVGELHLALVDAVRHPRRVRWRDAWLAAEAAGVNGLPIISLIGFLIGLIMSFQAAIPLRQFGADILVADLIALSMLRELGPLMTAIILAGRTGSAFAAELGTMKINEEVDALKTLGLDPVRFLVVTRVLAAVFVTPLLTLYANLMGLVGGAVVLLSLGFPLSAYIVEVRAAVQVGDLLGGLLKAFVFGVLIAATGCLRGLQTRTGASAVGVSTTRAVVSSIVLIALADGVFAVVYYYLGI